MTTGRDIRRQDRALSRQDALELLRRAEYGVLSSVDPDGQPYGVPLSFCLIDDAIYFHSALEGHKLDNIAGNPRVSFCVVGGTEVLPDKFGTRYTSAIVFGAAEEVFGSDKQRALEGFVSKYSPGYVEKGLKYIETMTADARVFRVRVESISGKARR
jgi:nitroimidazol reductase NimA-like FMN-containing flavoprotein (pyridoxamine 5'-phosphate oxidase superfamily)